MIHPWVSRLGAPMALSFLGLASGGCLHGYSANHAYMEPLQTKYPVSATGHYLERGAIIAPEQYLPLKSFHLERTFQGKAFRQSVVSMELERDLDQIVERAGGDALTNVTIRANNYDEGGHRAVGWNVLGWMCMFPGIVVTGLTMLDDGHHDAYFNEPGDYKYYAIGGGLIALGVASFVAGMVRREVPTQWEIAIDGEVVKRRPVAVEPPAAPVAPEPEPPAAAAPTEPATTEATGGVQ